MATSSAAVGLKFDIVADKSGFSSAVQGAQSEWRSATADMESHAGGIGNGFMSAVGTVTGAIGGLVGGFLSAVDQGVSGVERQTLATFDGVKKQAASMLDGLGDIGEKVAGKFGKRVGDAVAGGVKSLIDPVTTTLAGWGNSFITSEWFQEKNKSLSELATNLDTATGAVGGLGEKLKSLVSGTSNAVQILAGMRIKTEDFEAILAPLDKQIEKHERNIELIGKTAAEVAKLRAAWVAADAGSNIEGMAADQKAAYEEKLTNLATAAGSEEAARVAEQQRKAFEGITLQMDRQVELAEARTKEFGKAAGDLAEERALIDAANKMKLRGRELSEEELAIVAQKASYAGLIADIAAKENAERQALVGFERQRSQYASEAATMGLATEAAVAYKTEQQAIARLKEQNISLSDEFAARIKQESLAIGQMAGENARMRDSFQQIRETGQIAMRGLESVFDSFVEGRKISWSGMISSMIGDLAKLILKASVLQPLFGGGAGGGNGLVGDFFAGLIQPRAAGGPISSGQTYLVGENGPELFRSGSSGNIVPNHALGSGGAPINVAFSIDARGATPDAVEMLRGELFELKRTFTRTIIETVGEARGRGVMA